MSIEDVRLRIGNGWLGIVDNLRHTYDNCASVYFKEVEKLKT